MKTKEYSCWVYNYIADPSMTGNEEQIFLMSMPNSKALKARLIIEIPEKKITISESEFDEMLRSTPKWSGYSDVAKDIKQKLFSKEGDA